MISRKPKPFIFVHIPKCAGTSIERALIPLAIGPDKHHKNISQNERNNFWLPGRKGLQHAKLKRYAKYFALEEYFKFAFVRNPWDRAVSQIGFLRQLFMGKRLFQQKIFKECVMIYCVSAARIHVHDLGACQLDYLLNSTGEFDINFVGRFELLARDFGKVCEKIGVSPMQKLPHAFNSERQLHYSAFFDGESAGWIQKRFARDIDCFGYKFEEQASKADKQLAKQIWLEPVRIKYGENPNSGKRKINSLMKYFEKESQ